MIVKGIINKLVENGYQAEVKIPYLSNSYDPSHNVPASDVYQATICTLPGIKPTYKPGDVVYIGFEMDKFSLPVILGCLYVPTMMSSCDVDAQSLRASVNASLPAETYYKETMLDSFQTILLDTVTGGTQT